MAHDADDVDDSDNANDPHDIENADNADETDNADDSDDTDNVEDADQADDTDIICQVNFADWKTSDWPIFIIYILSESNLVIIALGSCCRSCCATKITMIAGFADTKH